MQLATNICACKAALDNLWSVVLVSYRCMVGYCVLQMYGCLLCELNWHLSGFRSHIIEIGQSQQQQLQQQQQQEVAGEKGDTSALGAQDQRRQSQQRQGVLGGEDLPALGMQEHRQQHQSQQQQEGLALSNYITPEM